MLPVLTWSCFTLPFRSTCSSVLDIGQTLYVPSGRIALALAMKTLGIGQGNEVLLPAYHCPSMVAPVRWLGATPVFYKIHEDTSPNITDIQEKITNSTRTILAVHFFGFPQDLRLLRSICDSKGISLIEDCVHAVFDCNKNTLLGALGDFTITSPRKFFPLYDGGCLTTTRHSLNDIRLQSLGLVYNIRSLLDVLEIGLGYHRLRGLQPLTIFFKQLRELIRRNNLITDMEAAAQVNVPAVEDQDIRFNKNSMYGKMSMVSKIILKSVSRQQIIAQRKKHYRILHNAFSGMSKGKLLFESFDESVVPHVFPLIIDDSDRLHQELKDSGVPIWRWDDIETDVCSVSNRYSRSVILLPCHQALTEEELDQVVNRVQKVLN